MPMQVKTVSGQNTASGVNAQRHVAEEGRSGEDDDGNDVISCVHCLDLSGCCVLLLDKN